MDIPPPEADVAYGRFDAMRDEFVAALERGDAAFASSFYAPDARLLSPSARLFRGRVSIERFWRAGLDAGLSNMELETIESARDDLPAYEAGRYALVLHPAHGTPVVDRGAYLRVYQEQADGSWLWTIEVFNPVSPSLRPGTTPTRGGLK